MAITKLSLAAVEFFADGQEFGEAGPYLRIHGVAAGELDPTAPQNQVIVDLDKARAKRARACRIRSGFVHSAAGRSRVGEAESWSMT